MRKNIEWRELRALTRSLVQKILADAMKTSFTPHILVVDDEQSILTALTEILTIIDAKLEVSTATSAEEAIDLLMRHHFDILITDLRLPTMSGLELLETVPLISPRTKSILMTAYGDAEIRSRASASGCRAYLEKPFEIDKLLNHIASVIEKCGKCENSEEETLADALRNYAENCLTGVLQVMNSSGSGHLTINDGVVIDAKFNNEVDGHALLKILAEENLVVSSSKSVVSTHYNIIVPPRTVLILLALSSTAERLMYLERHLSHVLQQRNEQVSEAIPLSKTENRRSEIAKFLIEGMQHYRAGNYEHARICWSSALKFDPTCQEALLYLQSLKGVTAQN